MLRADWDGRVLCFVARVRTPGGVRHKTGGVGYLEPWGLLAGSAEMNGQQAQSHSPVIASAAPCASRLREACRERPGHVAAAI